MNAAPTPTTAQTRPGYKLTPLGWIPDEWEVVKLKSVARVQGGYAFKSHAFTSDGLYQVVKMSNVYGGELDLSRSDSYLDKINKQEKDYLVNVEDILLSLTGTVGKRDYGHTVYIKNAETKNLLLNQRVGRLITTKCNSHYLYYTTKTLRFLDQFFFSARGGTGNQANVGTADVENILIPLPPLPEQRKIAAVLGAWDAAIEKTESLLTALRERHRALQQRLLTGQTRFPGFQGEDWQEVKLGDVFEPVIRKNIRNEELEVMTISGKKGFMSQSEKFNRVIAGRNVAQYTVLHKGEFSYNKGNSDLYPYGCIYRMDNFDRALVPNVYISFRAVGNIDSDFFTHYFQFGSLNSQLPFIINSGVRNDGLLNIDGDAFWKLKIKMPLTLAEQQRISAVLGTSMGEIRQMAGQLAQLQQQKKALMQQLLTGQMRVKHA